ncbi:hypothetical protein C0J52_07692 [Blattella germanica]|nr:hypothetical protein C0J52_07692 [Blattella germanica]
MSDFKKSVSSFYSNCIEYIDQWSSPFTKIFVLDWVRLHSLIEWDTVQNSLNYINTCTGKQINDSYLFNEVANVRAYASSDKIQEWNNVNMRVHLRWVEIFKHFKEKCIPFSHICNVVEFSLSLPASNAPTERVFSITNNLWTNEKSQLKTETLKHLII